MTEPTLSIAEQVKLDERISKMQDAVTQSAREIRSLEKRIVERDHRWAALAAFVQREIEQCYSHPVSIARDARIAALREVKAEMTRLAEGH